MDVSKCYGGVVVRSVISSPEGFAKILNAEEVVYAVIAIGMHKFSYPNYVDRKDANIERL